MHDAGEALLLAESSTLINFLRIDRADLLIHLGFRLLVTDVVRREIKERYQSERLEAALTRGEFEEVTLTAVADHEAVASLKSDGLGDGESVSIVAAHRYGATLAIDDRTATKVAKIRYPSLACVTTQDLMVLNIQQSRLTVAEADAIKEIWRLHHRFALKLATFGELVDDTGAEPDA